jgi:hypothetical protein
MKTKARAVLYVGPEVFHYTLLGFSKQARAVVYTVSLGVETEAVGAL